MGKEFGKLLSNQRRAEIIDYNHQVYTTREIARLVNFVESFRSSNGSYPKEIEIVLPAILPYCYQHRIVKSAELYLTSMGAATKVAISSCKLVS